MATEQQEQKMNGAVVQEASSTTPGEEVENKRTFRVKTWRKIQEHRAALPRTLIFNKIPEFKGDRDAAALLADTEEFKKAVNIKVNVDRPQDPVRLQVVANGKNLYVTPLRESNALYSKVECPPDADEQAKKRILQRLRDCRQDIPLENKVPLDMVVVGSVLVSKEGRRIGKGNGFVDLDLGLLIHTGAITPETVIVTTVHDLQVTDTLPEHLFEKFDCPVDMIVTQTQVIRVEKKLPRPKGIFWEILSERRCKIVQVLQTIKENEEKEGKIITLKSEDTDIETNVPRQRPRPRFRRFFNRYSNRSNRTRSQGNNSQNREEFRPRRRRIIRNRRPTRSQSEPASGTENKVQNSEQNQQQQQQKTMRRKRNKRDYCFKVSNIARGVRVKDLKAELRKRDCNPIYITWRGFGKCYLHFAKKKGSDKDQDVESLTNALKDLKLTIQNGDRTKTVNLMVELLQDRQESQQNNDGQNDDTDNVEQHENKVEQQNQRIESVDATSV